MIKRIFEWLMSPMGRVGVLIVALSLFSLAAYGIYTTQQSPEQPIDFPHSTHVKLGVQCLYCHPGALRGPSPGLPTINKCWGCHQQIAKTFDETNLRLKPMRDRVNLETNQPVEGFVWIPVAQVPDFVHFTHRPHVAAGLNCENCHGELSEMGIYENPQVLNMGWCLDCHKEKAGDDKEKFIKLTDCGTCHY
jgi:hypothetical protein